MSAPLVPSHDHDVHLVLCDFSEHGTAYVAAYGVFGSDTFDFPRFRTAAANLSAAGLFRVAIALSGGWSPRRRQG